ncbi:MAG: hypothetical protein V3W41_18015 [Planctomycetota bacterium]
MKKKLIGLIAGVIGTTGVAVKASSEGWGVDRPLKEPVSIREESMKGPMGSGRLATRYFIGGGPRRGK